MTDISHAPGWWQASDGNWYAPELAQPAAPPAPTVVLVDTATATHGTGFAVTSMVLGIIALALSFIPFVNALTFPLAVIALPFGGIAMTKKYQGHGMAIAGIVTAVLSLGIVIAMIAVNSN